MERAQRFRMGNMSDKEATSVGCAAEFIVDESIIETSGSSISGGGRVVDTVWARPINCTETHGAGFTGRVEIASGQLEIGEDTTRVANGFDFGVSGVVVGRCDTVDGFGDDFAVFHD